MNDAATPDDVVPMLSLEECRDLPDDPTEVWSPKWLAPPDVGVMVELWRSHLRMHRLYREESLSVFFQTMLAESGEFVPRDPADDVPGWLTGLYLHSAIEAEQNIDEASPRCGAFEYSLVPARTTWRWPEREVGKRPPIHEPLRRAVLVRDRGCCRYCGEPALFGQLDHVVPHSTGGSTTLENLVLACISCNGLKNTYCWIPRDTP